MNTYSKTIPNHLVSAYQLAEYRVFSPHGSIQLKVGDANPDLMQLLQHHSANSAALITSDNPGSQIFSDRVNQQARARLTRQVELWQLTYWKSSSTSSTKDWPEERGLFVLNISKWQALSLANQFNQNAILWIEPDKTVELVFVSGS